AQCGGAVGSVPVSSVMRGEGRESVRSPAPSCLCAGGPAGPHSPQLQTHRPRFLRLFHGRADCVQGQHDRVLADRVAEHGIGAGAERPVLREHHAVLLAVAVGHKAAYLCLALPGDGDGVGADGVALYGLGQPAFFYRRENGVCEHERILPVCIVNVIIIRINTCVNYLSLYVDNTRGHVYADDTETRGMPRKKAQPREREMAITVTRRIKLL